MGILNARTGFNDLIKADIDGLRLHAHPATRSFCDAKSPGEGPHDPFSSQAHVNVFGFEIHIIILKGKVLRKSYFPPWSIHHQHRHEAELPPGLSVKFYAATPAGVDSNKGLLLPFF